MKKRILAFALVLALCMCLVPVASFADSPASTTINPVAFITGVGSVIRAGAVSIGGYIGTGVSTVMMVYNMVLASIQALVQTYYGLVNFF